MRGAPERRVHEALDPTISCRALDWTRPPQVPQTS